jgi:hypothetical protein
MGGGTKIACHDDQAMPEIGDLARRVGETPRIKDLEEKIPDARMRLFELVQQHHREWLLADAMDQALGLCMPGASEQICGRIGSLEFAHVEADQAIGRSEKVLGAGPRKLRLSRAGRPCEQKDAERPVRIDESGFEHGDAIDDATNRLFLPYHAGREKLPHNLQIQRLVGIEQSDGKPGQLRDRAPNILRPKFRLFFAACRRELHDLQRSARECTGAQILTCALHCGLRAGRVKLQIALNRQFLDQLARHGARAFFFCWIELDGFQNRAQRRARLNQARGCTGTRLGPYHNASGRYRRKYLIENARALPLMRTAACKLQEIRYVPDQLLRDRDLLGCLANAPLELSEPDLSCHQIGTARFKDRPAFAAQTTGEQAQQRAFSDERLAADQQRPGHGLLQRGGGDRQRLSPSVGLN